MYLILKQTVQPLRAPALFWRAWVQLPPPVWVIDAGSNFIPLRVAIQLSQHCLWKMLSFLQCVFVASLSNIKWLKLCVLMFGSSRLVFLLGPYCFYYYSCIYYCILSSRTIIPPALFFLVRIVSALWDHLWFHLSFRIVFFSFSVKYEIGILLNL